MPLLGRVGHAERMRVRLRYTILYGVLFLISGVGLLGLTAAFGFKDTTHVPTDGYVPAGEQIAQLRQQLAESSHDQTRRLYFGAIAALGIMLLVSLLLGRAAAGRVLRPLRTLTAATRRITADNLHERLAVPGPADEVKALADTIDDLLERLEESFAAQRRFVANASHELRTPLATIRASLDVAMAKPGPVPEHTAVLTARVRAELDQVDRLLEGFLVLTRAQHGALDDREPVLWAPLVQSALRARSAEIKDKDLQVYASDPAGAGTVGNRVLLARMVENVITNAVLHNVDGGWLRVLPGPSSLVVESSGPVLDAAEVARLGRPFQRLGTDRTGTGSGLGLSIVGAVASAHGGSLALVARDGGGLRVEIALPAVVPA
jgi:signal transduction histidine kinase